MAGGGGGSRGDGGRDDGVEGRLGAMVGGLVAFGEGVEMVIILRSGLWVGIRSIFEEWRVDCMVPFLGFGCYREVCSIDGAVATSRRRLLSLKFVCWFWYSNGRMSHLQLQFVVVMINGGGVA